MRHQKQSLMTTYLIGALFLWIPSIQNQPKPKTTSLDTAATYTSLSLWAKGSDEITPTVLTQWGFSRTSENVFDKVSPDGKLRVVILPGPDLNASARLLEWTPVHPIRLPDPIIKNLLAKPHTFGLDGPDTIRITINRGENQVATWEETIVLGVDGSIRKTTVLGQLKK